MKYIENLPGEKYGNGRESTNPGKFNSATVQLAPDQVVVDIDNLTEEQFKAIIQTFTINTQYSITDRGYHLYFRHSDVSKLKSNCTCVLGFPTEYKKGQVTERYNGITREMINEGQIEELPSVFEQLTTNSLLGLEDGDGRYMGMFKHHISLMKKGIDNRERIMEFINDNILGTPIADEKLETAMKFTPETISLIENQKDRVKYIMQTMEPLMFEGQLALFHYDRWLTDTGQQQAAIYTVFDDLSTHQVDEILKQITYRLVDDISFHDIKKIKLKNGVLYNGKFVKVDYREFTPFHVDWEYKPELENEKVDTFMQVLTDDDPLLESYIYQLIGQSFNLDFVKRGKYPYFHVFYGDGGNGKSLLTDIIKSIFNDDVMSTQSPKDIDHTSGQYALKGKLVNVVDEIEKDPIKNHAMRIIKSASSCSSGSLREIYGSAENNIVLFSNLIFNSNHLLKTWEKGNSIIRRLRWVPILKKMSEDERITDDVVNELYTTEGIEYFFKKVVEAYFEIYQNGFTTVPVIEKFNREYHSVNDPLIDYIDSLDIDDILGVKPKMVYDDYVEWFSSEMTGEPIGSNKFQQSIKAKFNLTTAVARNEASGKPTRQFVKKEDDEG